MSAAYVSPVTGSLEASGPNVDEIIVRARQEIERVAGVDLMDQDGGSPAVRIERVASVGGRTFYSVRTKKDDFGFYVTRTGLIRGAR